MLSTLYRIGEILLKDQDIWARLTIEPKFTEGGEVRNWVCPVLLDCIEEKITFVQEEMERFYPGRSAAQFRYLNTELWGRRGRKCAVTIAPDKFKMLPETLFGKRTAQAEAPMAEAIQSFDPKLCDEEIFVALKEISTNLRSQANTLTLDNFKANVSLGPNEKVVLFYATIRSKRIRGGKAVPLFALKGYQDFIIGKFATYNTTKVGLDYVTGSPDKAVLGAKFKERVNILKIFQSTTRNYAVEFSHFEKNFLASPASLDALEIASDHLSERQARIAGIPHIVIPTLLQKDINEQNLRDAQIFTEVTSDLLFQAQDVDRQIRRNLVDVDFFWLNYIAFESDGNSFKIINHIKDVNSVHLRNVIHAFNCSEIDILAFLGDESRFNLHTLYSMIPVRGGDKTKLNEPLAIFKNILEQRSIPYTRILRNFVSLVLCHRYNRYQAYSNIKYTKSFDFAVRDAVTKYSALFHALRNLKLLAMDDSQPSTPSMMPTSTTIQENVDEFFRRMRYNDAEKSMFYLGRVLSQVAAAQYKKGHKSKPILNKVDFNGMEVSKIIRLSLDLEEKSRQYNIMSKTEWDFARFREVFDAKNWAMPPEHSVFYLMAGYSFSLMNTDFTKNYTQS